MNEHNPIEINLHQKSRLLEISVLRQRGMRWKRNFADDAIQFTVNKEFAELFTILEQGDEIALIPKAR
ncbi:MAG: hypothetical protein IME94_11100 [Proteobacteria bacterium]|nr:hypothetical protein [Pseudomonadota bacterium]